MERFAPDIFLIGAAKCGTTALSHWLRSHPELFLPDKKEPHHFSGPFPGDRHKQPVLELSAYQALYANADGHTIDASTSYISSLKARDAILAARPDAKIIICLREPVKKTWSGFMMHDKFGEQDPEAWLQANVEGHRNGAFRPSIENALYGKYVPEWTKHFDCHIIESAHMRQDGQRIFDELCEFLGVSKAPIPELDAAKANAYRTPKNRAAKWIFNSKFVAAAARIIVPLSLRKKMGDSLLQASEKPSMPASWPEKLWPIFAPDLERLREATGREFSTLGP